MELKERKDAKIKELESLVSKINETNSWLQKLNTKAVAVQGQIQLLEEMEKPEKKEK